MFDLKNRLGVKSWSFREIKDNVECAKAIRYCGASIVDLSGCHLDYAAPDTWDACIAAYRDNGVTFDGIGAIGIARSFHFAGRIGARVHNTEAEALSDSSYSREDSAYREYLVKLRYVKDKLLTESGKQMAKQRHEFMVAFFNQLNEETLVSDK